MYPEWVLKHKTKGTNISRIKGKYYLYAVSSKWNKRELEKHHFCTRSEASEDGVLMTA